MRSQTLLFFVGEVINNYGYQTMIINDSAEALAIFKKEPDRFALIVSDQTMPELTDIDLILQIRDIKPKLPAILCSGYIVQIDKKDAKI
jgi:CheY-like chemotaxis protein